MHRAREKDEGSSANEQTWISIRRSNVDSLARLVQWRRGERAKEQAAFLFFKFSSMLSTWVFQTTQKHRHQPKHYNQQSKNTSTKLATTRLLCVCVCVRARVCVCVSIILHVETDRWIRWRCYVSLYVRKNLVCMFVYSCATGLICKHRPMLGTFQESCSITPKMRQRPPSPPFSWKPSLENIKQLRITSRRILLFCGWRFHHSV